MLTHRVPIILAMAFALIAAFPSPGRAQVAPLGKWWNAPRIAQRLDLTADEKHELDALFLHNRRNLIGLKAAVERQRFELEHALEQERLDEAAVMDAAKGLEDARRALALEQTRFLIGVRKTIGAARFQELKKIHQEFRRKRNRSQRN